MEARQQMELERVRYWQGQMLASRDLRDQVMFDQILRWWHNRALHNSYGVVDGLEVEPLPQAGATLAAVLVERGLAYDVFGRELFNQRPQTVALPQVKEPMLLLARYLGADSFVEFRREGRPAQEQIELCWAAASRCDSTAGVALARVMPGPALDPTFHVARSRPLARPRIAHGATVMGATNWRIWGLPSKPRRGGMLHEWIRERMRRNTPDHLPLGLRVRVDTSAAGFTQTPCYLAWLYRDDGAPLAWPPGVLPFMYSYVQDTAATRFNFRVWVPLLQYSLMSQFRLNPRIVAAVENDLLAGAARQKLYVCWLGIQQPSVEEGLEFPISQKGVRDEWCG